MRLLGSAGVFRDKAYGNATFFREPQAMRLSHREHRQADLQQTQCFQTSMDQDTMRKLATIRTVNDIQPIPDADMIELAVVDGWKCVIRKGEFKVGDAVIYCEIDSFLPVREEFEFLRKSSLKVMDGREGFRLRTVKLRGQISQGLLLSPAMLKRSVMAGEDVTQELGIVKYEPPIPACLGGTVVGPFPTFVSRTDEERIQNLASEFDSYRNRTFHVSEKIDGTSFTAFFYDGNFGVCGRNWQLADDQSNSHWRMVHSLNLRQQLEALGQSIAIQGELIGPGIQNNRYAVKDLELLVFNIYDITTSSYLEKTAVDEICSRLNLKTVPAVGIWQVPDSIDQILQLAEGKSALNSGTEREGLVWTTGSGNHRVSFKTISNRFLNKYNE